MAPTEGRVAKPVGLPPRYPHWPSGGGQLVGTCESFFSFESNLESNRPYTTQAVTQPNGLQAYRTVYYS